MRCALKAPVVDADLPTVLMLAAFLVGAVTVPLLGGRLARLEHPGFRRWALIAVAFVLQTATVSLWPGMPNGLAVALHLVSYGCIAAFLVANRRIAGLWIVAVGTACNALAIALNDGVMPARRAALRLAGRLPARGEFSNSNVVPHPKLGFLGDVFAVPKGFPLANVFSVGDVLIVVGAIAVLHHICGSRLARGRDDEAAPEASTPVDVPAPLRKTA